MTTLDALVYTDTSWYVPGTNQLERFVSYAPVVFDGSLEPNTQTIISYNGSQIIHEDHYLNTGSSGLEWTHRAVYSYNGGGSEPSEYALHTVINNVINPSPNDYTIFEKDAQNRHYRTLNITAAGDTSSILTFEYDQEFVTHTTSEMWNFDLVLYTDRETFYYYEDTPLSVDPLTEIEVAVYPNPATDVIYATTPAKVDRIQLANSNGQVLIEQHSTQLDVAHLAPGNYILIGFTDQGRFTKKIVKL